MARLEFDRSRATLRQQQNAFDRGRWRAWPDHVTECLGHHLAKQQANDWCLDRWTASGAGACTPGIHRLAHKYVALSAVASLHGNLARRLADFWRTLHRNRRVPTLRTSVRLDAGLVRNRTPHKSKSKPVLISVNPWNLRNLWKVEGGLVPPLLFATLLAHPHHRFVTLSPDNSSENILHACAMRA